MLVRTEAVGVKVFRNATHIHALRGEGYFFEECLRKIETVWAHSEEKNLFQTSIQICTCGKPYSCRWIFSRWCGNTLHFRETFTVLDDVRGKERAFN